MKSNKTKSTVWISFDFGLSGDYEGMYRWLDSHGAKECGDAFAILQNYEYKENLVSFLTKDIKENVTLNKNARIYVICHNDMKGRFIVGGRKASPWTGYAGGTEQEEPES